MGEQVDDEADQQVDQRNAERAQGDDERLDPAKATVAAAKLLRDNYKALGNWPLAITAYNHGRAGMLRSGGLGG